MRITVGHGDFGKRQFADVSSKWNAEIYYWKALSVLCTSYAGLDKERIEHSLRLSFKFDPKVDTGISDCET